MMKRRAGRPPKKGITMNQTEQTTQYTPPAGNREMNHPVQTQASNPAAISAPVPDMPVGGKSVAMHVADERERLHKTRRHSRETRPVIGRGMPSQIQGLDPNYEYYWAYEDQIPLIQETDWDFVSPKDMNGNRSTSYGMVEFISDGQNGDRVRQVANPNAPVTDPKRYQWLMRKRKDWYEEDDARKNRMNDQLMDALSNPDIKSKGVENAYKPNVHLNEGDIYLSAPVNMQ